MHDVRLRRGGVGLCERSKDSRFDSAVINSFPGTMTSNETPFLISYIHLTIRCHSRQIWVFLDIGYVSTTNTEKGYDFIS